VYIRVYTFAFILKIFTQKPDDDVKGPKHVVAYNNIKYIVVLDGNVTVYLLISHTSRTRVNEFLPILFIFIERFCRNSVQKICMQCRLSPGEFRENR
jgi:hypothetical protein